MAMAESGKWIRLILLVMFMLFVGAIARVPKEIPETENGGSEKLQSSSNSTMAVRLDETKDLGNEHAVDNPEEIAAMVDMSIRNATARRELGFFSCGTGNPIDDCWRCDPNWQQNRKRLADCGIGFGRNAIGGRDGRFYVVTDSGDDNPVNPKPGTLRHAVIQDEPLWIVFKRDMVIQLKQELIMNSFKTIDARGTNVHIANGACLTIQFVTNVIVHGLNIHDCKPTGNAMVRSSPNHVGWRTIADGDAISIFGSSHIWIDHNSLSNCADGLVDAVMGSTAITISNNYFTHHNEVMLLGHSDSYVRDKLMQVTIAYNHFGEGLIQRMPRCRHGYFHVVNNDYTHWEMYAIGGSANPTINSQGNRYAAPTNPFAKEVTKRVETAESEWKGWNWRSEGDLLLNGAFFTPSGAGASASYARASSLGAKSSSMVGTITSNAGALSCRRGHPC
ncbi:putative pectate lyase 8 [Cucumis melo var. makuwa]|uniref:Pectate lyase n=2 Tax=Cucumis melo TaxID=3656 RepID=A0A1S3AWX2_CUCME|nr:probable pectate lyase 8 [Cucumis melo]KAA0049176.1 putative pectate lyase 8 [Cucumis melo var. makuwa]TYK17384.1 putative pectate lyase 8 [Cucumis melo var. makuwa]